MDTAIRRGKLNGRPGSGQSSAAPVAVRGTAAGGAVAGLVVAVLTVPIAAGLIGTLLPAFGYLPALGGTALTLEPFRALMAEPAILRSAFTSFYTGLVTTAVALTLVMLFVAGFAGTAIFSRIQHLVSPLLAVPHAAVAFGLAVLIAPSGLLVRLVSPTLTGFTRPPDWLIPGDALGITMMAGLIIKEMPFLFLVSLAALPQLPVDRARQMAAGFGYGRIAGFVFGLSPALYRQIRLPVLAVLAYAGSTVDVAMILGPDLPAPLSVRIGRWMAESDSGLRFIGSAGAVLQLGVTLCAILLWFGIERMAGCLFRHVSAAGLRFRHDAVLRGTVCFTVALSAALVFFGLAALGLWSVAALWRFPAVFPESLTLDGWMSGLQQSVRPIAVTVALGVAVSAAALLLAIGLLTRESTVIGRQGGGVRRILYLPLIVPQVGFVFGLQVLASGAGVPPGMASLFAVHLVFVLPYVILSLSPPWHAFDRRFEIVAASLQASPVRSLFFIRLPILLRPCLTAFAIGFAVSVGLYLPTLLIGAGRIATVTTEAVALSSGGDRRLIGVYALLQTALPFVAFAIASIAPQWHFRKRRSMRV